MVTAVVSKDPIDIGAMARSEVDPRDGAMVLFVGIVRNHADGRPVEGMTYEAYEEMAQPVLTEIAEEAARRLGSDRIHVVHRIGDLRIGEASVAICASSPHRAESFDAARYVIEEIKKRLPVWKKEWYSDGARDWVAGRVPPGTGRTGAGR